MSTNAAEKNSYASYKQSEHSMKQEYNSKIAETEPHQIERYMSYTSTNCQKQDQNGDKHRQYQIGRFEHKIGLGSWVRRNRGALTLFSLFTSVYSMQQTAVVIDGDGGGDRRTPKGEGVGSRPVRWRMTQLELLTNVPLNIRFFFINYKLSLFLFQVFD